MKRLIAILGLTVLVFYHIYPPALQLFGFSFIFTSGALGVVMYLNNGRPYPVELFKIVCAYLFFGFFTLLTMYIWFRSDSYFFNNTKSQIAWLFSGYFVTYVFFRVHPKGSFIQLLYYVVAALVIQGVISLLMYQFPAVSDFFSSLQVSNWLESMKRDETEGQRLLGYGIAFFGSGIIYGMGLILIAFIITKKSYDTKQLVILSLCYGFIFFVGLLTARTTLVGLAASIIYIVLFYLLCKEGNRMKFQFIKFAAFATIWGSIGYSLCYVYFPEFADWAFEVFINFSETGKFRTTSSDSIEYMMVWPEELKHWVFGVGTMEFWGSDVGYSRLVWFVGIPGTFAFFFYQFILAKLSMTKDIAQNIMLLIVIGYVLALNVKGLADVNSFLYLFVFYFLHYRYNIYLPQIYRLGKIKTPTIRDAVQSPAPVRRV